MIIIHLEGLFKRHFGETFYEESKYIKFNSFLQIFFLQECAADEKDDGLMEKV